MSIGAECLRIARACNTQNSFLNSINPLVCCMALQEAKKCRIAEVSLKFFNKHQRDFNCYKNWERITSYNLISIINNIWIALILTIMITIIR